jgi:pimeloyl-ACP methyl ester carboxylesterase
MDGMDRQVTLSDGRKLGFRESGSRDGFPLFYFHGFPGSRKEAGLLNEIYPNGIAQGTSEQLSEGSGWRIFAIDRPGMGLSDFQPNRSLKDWPNDIEQFADLLGIARFTIIGISGGGPYAASCAWALRERVICAGIACGPDQLAGQETSNSFSARNRTALNLIRHFPWLNKSTYAASAFFLKRWPLMMLDSQMPSMPIHDQEALKIASVRETLSDSFLESLRQGSAGGAQEMKILCNPWGFDLGEIQTPVALWHGELDTIVPVIMGREIAAQIPNCRASFFDSDGHYSLLVNRGATILGDLHQITVAGR